MRKAFEIKTDVIQRMGSVYVEALFSVTVAPLKEKDYRAYSLKKMHD
jgi:hypothetical protein